MTVPALVGVDLPIDKNCFSILASERPKSTSREVLYDDKSTAFHDDKCATFDHGVCAAFDLQGIVHTQNDIFLFCI